MSDPVEFYFDFSSPYAYFAAQKVDELVGAFDREVDWRPMMLGVALKETGSQPLAHIPMKSSYCINDWERLARYQHLSWKMPEQFPFAALAPTRAFYWIADRDLAKAKAFAWDCFTSYFGEGKDISTPDAVAAIAARHGIADGEVKSALQDDAVKQRVKDETARAIDKGVFGSPFLIVDGEPFWGADRFWMVRRWLKSGGW